MSHLFSSCNIDWDCVTCVKYNDCIFAGDTNKKVSECVADFNDISLSDTIGINIDDSMCPDWSKPGFDTSNSTGLIVGLVMAAAVVFILMALAVFCYRKKKAGSNEHDEGMQMQAVFDGERVAFSRVTLPSVVESAV